MTLEPNPRLTSPESVDMLNRVRAICSDLPECEELIDGFSHSVFKVRGKSFVMLGESNDGDSVMSFKSDRESQELLIAQPDFYRTPYIGQHGWVSVRNPQQWETLGDLLREAYLLAAPKKLVQAYQQRQGATK